MTDVFEAGAEHEQVVFCHDPASGLRAIIALHNTALGPGLGGTRFYPYASTDDALRDVLNLSRGMTYKNALAGLDLGGGKAVIIGDPATHEDRGPAAGLRPVRAVAERSLLHRLRRRHFLRGHGPHRPRVRLRHRPHRRPRRCRRLVGAHGVRRVPGHARLGRGDLGRAHAGRARRRDRRRRQGRPAPGPAPHRGRRRGRGHRRERRGRAAGARGAPGHAGRPLDRGPARGAAGRLLAERPRRRADRRRRRGAHRRASSAAAPTTSWPTPAWRSGSRSAASSTPPTTA